MRTASSASSKDKNSRTANDPAVVGDDEKGVHIPCNNVEGHVSNARSASDKMSVRTQFFVYSETQFAMLVT